MRSKNPAWQQVRLREILTYVEDLAPLEDFREYMTITVKRRHGGLEPRERRHGHEIKTKKQYRLIPGAFLISRIQCWHQAYAIVPEDVPGNMIASQNYDQFTISPTVDSRFFWWFSHSPFFTETVRSSAFGVVIEKMVFNREAWLDKPIPLPPLDEQRRIVSRIEDLAAKIEAARHLLAARNKEIKVLLSSAVEAALTRLRSETKETTVLEVAESVTDGDHQPPPKSESGIPFVFINHVVSGRVDFTGCNWVSKDYFQSLSPTRVPGPGDILYTAVGSYGIPCLVETEQPFCFQRHIAIIKPDRSRILPGYLMWALSSRSVFEQATKVATGSAQLTVPLRGIRQLRFPLPAIEIQRETVSYLDGLQAKIDSLKKLQSETAAELDALMPSFLSKAFRGEL
jgi:type I restriction enzyme, S subunit